MANVNLNNTEGPAESVAGIELFFAKHRVSLLVGVIVVLAVIVGVFLYRNYVLTPREEKASTALAKPQELFTSGDFTGAAEGFEKVASAYSGTKAANLAELYAGLCYANSDDWEKAVDRLEKFASSDDAMVSPAAMAALGNAYANTGNVDKAISSLRKAAKMADDEALDGVNYTISATFLMQAAGLLESQGKASEALALYKEIRDKYINAVPVQTKIVDRYIERLEEK